MAQYSQFAAFSSLMKGSLRSILKSPSSVIFTIAFPLIFIVAFGWMDKGNIPTDTRIGVQTNDGEFLSELTEKSYWNAEEINTTDNDSTLFQKYDFVIKTIGDTVFFMHPDNTTNYIQIEDHLRILLETYAKKEQLTIVDDVIKNQQSISKKIDYILPGQLGFSLLAASIFGTAFVFFSLRHTYVLKRFFATPINALSILMAEGFSRLLFQTFGALLLIIIGYFFFDLSLPSGILTILGMLLLSILGVISFMSFGFIISGIAKSEATVPPLANIVVLPQFIMSDTFIPIQDMPEIVQKISQILPLTHFNQAIRAFTQQSITQLDYLQLLIHILVISVWGVIGYILATKTFKWE